MAERTYKPITPKDPTQEELLAAIEYSHANRFDKATKELAEMYLNLYEPPPQDVPIGHRGTPPQRGFELPQREPEVDAFTGATIPAPKPPPPAPDFNLLRFAGERAGGLASGLTEVLGAFIRETPEVPERVLPEHRAALAERGVAPTVPQEPTQAPLWARKLGLAPLMQRESVAAATQEISDELRNLDLGYVPQSTWDRVKKQFSAGGALSGTAWGEVFRYGIETGFGSMADMALVLTSLPVYIVARSGEIGRTRAINSGREVAELEDVLEASPFALGSALLERIGAKGITQAGAEAFGAEVMKAGLSRAAGRVAAEGGRAAGKEALTEAFQEGIIEYIGEHLGTEASMSAAEAFERGLAGAVAGGVFGGTVGTGAAAGRAGIEAAQLSPEGELGRQLAQDVEGAQFEVPAEQVALGALDPRTAPMMDLVTDKLRQRGVDLETEKTLETLPFAEGEPEGVAEAGEIPGEPVGEIDEQAQATPEQEEVLDVGGAPLEDAPSEEGAAVDEAAVREGKARVSIDRRREIDPERDDLLAAVAKLGGLNTDEAIAQGVDPADVGRRGHGIKRVFTSKGRSFDDLAEQLVEDGYLEARDPNELATKITDSLSGRPQYSIRGEDARIDQLVEEQYLDAVRRGDTRLDRDLGDVLQGETYPADLDQTGMRLYELLAVVDDMAEGAADAILDRAKQRGLTDEQTITALEATIAGARQEGKRQEAPARTTTQEEREVEVFEARASDKPMPNWVAPYSKTGLPERPESDTIEVAGKTLKLKPVDKPTRAEGIRAAVKGMVGPRIYYNKIRGKSRLGQYKRKNSAIRVRDYNDVEVLAHEVAHYLDFHYKFHDRFKVYEEPRYSEEVKSLSYTRNPKVVMPEGFAEFVRLWMTNYDAAVSRAPEFTAEFEDILAQDRPLNRNMQHLRNQMHLWFKQGPEASFAAGIGKHLEPSERISEYLMTSPLERARQNTIDRIHAAKVVERTVHGDISDASRSAYKQFQMINGAESLYEAIVRYGTPKLEADGSLSYEGKGLKAVLKPISKNRRQFDAAMRYFAARRAQELMGQGRENLFTQQKIEAVLETGKQNPEFETAFREYQAFNARMLDWYVDMGLITDDQRVAFEEMNKNYVPFHRVVESIEHGEAGPAEIGQRLYGGRMNVKDIGENIVEGLLVNIRGALTARAKQTLFTDIKNSQDGSIFADDISPDIKRTDVEVGQMASKLAQIFEDMGIVVTPEGQVVQAIEGAETMSASDIEARLLDRPELMTFWSFGHKPRTVENYVDSAIIDGKQVWFEVHDPLLVDMLTGMRGFKSNALLNAMFWIKNLQTRTVTSMMQFLGPNAIRDTVSAFVISKNKFIPVVDTVIGMKHAWTRSDIYKEFMLQGGGYGTRIQARTAEKRARHRIDLPASNLWDVAAKFVAGWDTFASAFEIGSRIGDYKRGKRAGKTLIEAAWEAREVTTDFSKMGKTEMWAKFLRTVPFMNAGIQGLDKTAREIWEIKGKMTPGNLTKLTNAKVRFLAAGGTLTAMTLILWLINRDDERYKGLTPDQKARFWWIFPPGAEKPIKIPRPYDIGHIFATIPEVMLDQLEKDLQGDAAAQLAWTFLNTLGVGDYPGVLQPFIEIARDQKFNGAPIIPSNLVNAPVEYQYTDRTPQMYIEIGRAMNVSPLQAEHVVKGFLRYVEAYIADASEASLWNEEQWGDRPYRGDVIDYLTYQFQGRKVPYRTKYTEGYYRLKQRAAGIHQAARSLHRQAIRDGKPLKEFIGDKTNEYLLDLDKQFRAIDRGLQGSRDYLASIKYDKDMPGKEKEDKIEDFYRKKNEKLAAFYRMANEKLKQIEKEMIEVNQ